MPDPTTPKDLARELALSERRVRHYLRTRHGKLGPFVTRWQLTPEQAADVRAHFGHL